MTGWKGSYHGEPDEHSQKIEQRSLYRRYRREKTFTVWADSAGGDARAASCTWEETADTEAQDQPESSEDPAEGRRQTQGQSKSFSDE